MVLLCVKINVDTVVDSTGVLLFVNHKTRSSTLSGSTLQAILCVVFIYDDVYVQFV